MKLSTVAFVLAGAALALIAIGASAPAVNDTQVAPTNAAVVAASLAVILGMRAAAGDTGEWMVAAPHRPEERGAPREPVDRYHYRGDSAIQVSAVDVHDRSRKALQERALL